LGKIKGLWLAALLRGDLGVIWLGVCAVTWRLGGFNYGGLVGLERRVYRGIYGLDYGANHHPFLIIPPIS